MEYVQKLPFILGASMALIIGIINNNSSAETKTIYIRMSVGLVIFFILGLYIREFIYKLYEEIKKKEAEELKRAEEQKRKEEQEKKQKNEGTKHNVDYTVDDDSFETNINIEKDEKLYDEEFTPLSVNSIKLNKDNNN